MRTAVACIIVFGVTLAATSNVVHPVGTGVHAFSLGNNVVAMANDQTAGYWNPAGIAFVPIRQLQVGLDGLVHKTSSTYYQTERSEELLRPHLSNAGFLVALPTSRGGVGFSIGYASPYVFDDVVKFEGDYVNDSGTVSVSRDFSTYGRLDMWGGGFGIQVAPGLGVGVALSLVTGKERFRNSFLKTVSDTGISLSDYSNNFTDQGERRYVGYDLRIGLLYSILERYRVGLRVVAPQVVYFTEELTTRSPQTATTVDAWPEAEGRLVSSYRGALGASARLSFGTLMGEVRARAPYPALYPNERFPSGSPAKHTRFGAGAGLEVPVADMLLLKAGYSWDQYDPFIFALKYEGEPSPVWDTDGTSADKDRHLITGGLSWLWSQLRLDIAYGYQMWSLNTRGVLQEDHNTHRVSFALSVRY